MHFLVFFLVAVPLVALGTFLVLDLLNVADLCIPSSRKRRGLQELFNQDAGNGEYSSENKTKDSFLKSGNTEDIHGQDSDGEEREEHDYTDCYTYFPIILQPFTSLLIFLARHKSLLFRRERNDDGD